MAQLRSIIRFIQPALLLQIIVVGQIATSLRATAEEEWTETTFGQRIAPLIAEKCLGCHGENDPEGGLDLRIPSGRGDSEVPVILQDNLAESLLLSRILSDEMPPETPLSTEEKQLLKSWVLAGAVHPETPIDPFRYTSDSRAGLDWWSLQTIRPVKPPATAADSHPVDAFIARRLQQQGLTRSQQADRRTLIRRLCFDVLGIPPTPAEIQQFLEDDSATAWESLVDRVLASPHYGERWARHWLDVVRFGESNGFEYDQPRDNAWPYRNWLIDAFNSDMPYDEFARMQLAGDLLQPQDAAAAAASGFLVAGPHNTTLPSSDKMRKSMAQDEMEDLLGVVGQTFLGLTVNCSRCHDHKFDPISQREYYQLASAFAGVRHGTRDVSLALSPQQQQQLSDAQEQLASAKTAREQLLAPVRERILAQRSEKTTTAPAPPEAMAAWEFTEDLQELNGNLHLTLQGNAKISEGRLVVDGVNSFAKSQPLKKTLRALTLEAWVRLDNLKQRGGGVISVQTTDGQLFDAIVFGEREPQRWMAGSNGFVRSQSFSGMEETEVVDRFVHFAIVHSEDGTITAYRDGQPYGKSYRPGPLQEYPAGGAEVVFGFRHGAPGGNRMLQGEIERAAVYDRALSADEVAASAFSGGSQFVPESLVLQQLSESDQQQLAELDRVRRKSEATMKQLQQLTKQTIYTCVAQATPGVTHVLSRGDVSQPGAPAAPAGLRAVTGVDADFQLSPDAPDSERRIAAAHWITAAQNPLFARVMVNRVWHNHFGRGLVPTPGDFGFNGGRPQHPDLLDWLAATFQQSGFRLKQLHRLILTSETWKQQSLPREDCLAVDADNTLLWRRTPSRLEAEAVRDAMLVATGLLDRTIGGRGYRDMRHFKFKGSNFYEPVIEGEDGATWRRTIYRFIPRGGTNPFLDTFDCPDPSAAAQVRPETTTPLQALSLLNNEIVFRMSDALAERVGREAADSPEMQIRTLGELLWGRPLNSDEAEQTLRFADRFGLPALCRVMLNSNEFLYVR